MRYVIPWRWGNRGVSTGREAEGYPVDAFQGEMNRLFEDFFKGFGVRPAAEDMGSLVGFSPQVNMTEDEKSIQVSAELPGLDEKDIEISLTKDSLTIKGEKKEEAEHKDRETYFMERSFGSFTPFWNPAGLATLEKSEASFKKGVLTISLPKLEKETQTHKKIRIKSD